MNGLLAAALAAMAYAFALTSGNFSALVPTQVAVLLFPVAPLLHKHTPRMKRRSLLLWLALTSLLTAGLLVNLGNYPTTETTVWFACFHTVGIIGILFALQWAATTLCPQLILKYVAISLFPLIVYAIVLCIEGGGILTRQSPLGIHPNWWGEIAFAFAGSAMALRTWKGRLLMLIAAGVLMVFVQSRGALLATVVAVFAFVCSELKSAQLTYRRGLLAISTVIILLAALALHSDLVDTVFAFSQDKVLLLHDKYRGEGTGLTGRIDGWLHAIDVIFDEPLFGHGLDTLTSVHNGFLRIGAENGLPALLLILGIMTFAFCAALRNRNHLALSILLGYSAYAMTYPRMLNMNVASAIFYLSLFPWSRNSEGRAVTPGHAPHKEPRCAEGEIQRRALV